MIHLQNLQTLLFNRMAGSRSRPRTPGGLAARLVAGLRRPMVRHLSRWACDVRTHDRPPRPWRWAADRRRCRDAECRQVGFAAGFRGPPRLVSRGFAKPPTQGLPRARGRVARTLSSGLILVWVSLVDFAVAWVSRGRSRQLSVCSGNGHSSVQHSARRPRRERSAWPYRAVRHGKAAENRPGRTALAIHPGRANAGLLDRLGIRGGSLVRRGGSFWRAVTASPVRC